MKYGQYQKQLQSSEGSSQKHRGLCGIPLNPDGEGKGCQKGTNRTRQYLTAGDSVAGSVTKVPWYLEPDQLLLGRDWIHLTTWHKDIFTNRMAGLIRMMRD